MIGTIKRKMFYFCKRIAYREKVDSNTYIGHLRKIGMKVGHDVVFYHPWFTVVDETRPWLISIGDNVKITRGVTILTHGYDWSVLKVKYGEVLGSSGGVQIGNNVFIGMNSTILKGTHIGNNVIIGANSLVAGDIPSDCVAVGNPCKVLMTLDDYFEKRKKAQISEASECVRLYRKTYGKEADETVLREFFWLFEDNPNKLPEIWEDVNKLCGNESYTNRTMERHTSKFYSMKDFLESIE